MKRLFTTSVAFALATGTIAFAGGMAEPVMEAEVVEAATSSASQQIIVPLLLLLVIIAAATGHNAAPT